MPLLNEQQKQVYETLMQAVDNNTGGLFFLDAPGGTGKTFVISLILATIRSRCDIALALASSGIAATLLVPVDATTGLITLTNDFRRFVDSQLALIENVFPNSSENYQNYAWLSQRAIHAANNNEEHAVNFTIQSKIAGDLVTYKSVDFITDLDDVVNYPTECLNSLEIPGFPQHN